MGAVPAHAFADDGSGLHVERGEQRRRSVSPVIVGTASGLSPFPPRLHTRAKVTDVDQFTGLGYFTALRRGRGAGLPADSRPPLPSIFAASTASASMKGLR